MSHNQGIPWDQASNYAGLDLSVSVTPNWGNNGKQQLSDFDKSFLIENNTSSNSYTVGELLASNNGFLGISNGAIDYSSASARAFAKEHFGDDIVGLNELFADNSFPDGGYELSSDGFRVKAPDGSLDQGLTEPLGDGRSNVYLFKKAFGSREQLYLVMQHEFMHVTYNSKGLLNYNKQEAAAREWMLDQGKAWNYKVDVLQYIYDQSSSYLSKKYHYSRHGINILDRTPW